MTKSNLRGMSWIDYSNRRLTELELREMLEVADALWLHSGDPTAPHAELTSGKHSDGFVDVLRALRFTNISNIVAQALAGKIRDAYKGPIDWVIGSDHAGAVFSQNVALALSQKVDGPWNSVQHEFTEKGDGKSQLWKRFKIRTGEVVVQVEELMTTALTFEEVRKGIRAGNDEEVTFAPVAGVLVHRSPIWQIEDTKVIPFIHLDINVWTPEECPLCKAGSKVLRPKQNWAELTGRM